MGTRNLTVVQLDGKYKVAQYGQFDGYPSGLGVEILEFLKNFNLNNFIQNLKTVRLISQDEVNLRWKYLGVESGDLVTLEQSEQFRKSYPTLHREYTGYDLFLLLEREDVILEKTETGNIELESNLAFAADSLFCEWCYVIDLDKAVLEVYKGFNKKPLTAEDRFYFLQKQGSLQYYPVKIVKAYPLYKLPSKQEFITDLERA